MPRQLGPRAISLVVAGGSLAALLGPELSMRARTTLADEFLGSYVVLLMLYIVQGLAAAMVQFGMPLPDGQVSAAAAAEQAAQASGGPATRSLRGLLGTQGFLAAAVVAGVAYSAMGALMAATPLAMDEEAYTFADSTLAIQMHVLGMFVPSLFTGDLVAWLGPVPIMVLGTVVLEIGTTLFHTGLGVEHFALGLTVVGVGWNMAFVASTSLYSNVVRPSELPTAQAFTELIVLGMLSIFVFSAAYQLAAFGWSLYIAVYQVYIGVAIVGALSFWIYVIGYTRGTRDTQIAVLTQTCRLMRDLEDSDRDDDPEPLLPADANLVHRRPPRNAALYLDV